MIIAKMDSLRKPFIFHIVAFVVLVAHVDAYETDCLGGHLLRAPEIRIIASVQSYIAGPDGTYIKHTTQVHEHYSNQQQRARLELHPIERPNPESETNVIYYFDHLIDRRLLKSAHIDNGIKCDSSDASSLAKSLFGVTSKMDQHFSGESWMELGSTSVPAHIIGLSRILFLVDQRRQLLEDATTSRMRGQESISYDYTGPDLDGINVIVHYADTEEHKAGTDLPKRIFLSHTSNHWRLIIDFFQVDEIHRDFFEHLNELDQFSFPVGLSCSQSLGRYNLGALEWFVRPEIRVASYEARVREHLRLVGSDGQSVVEYERFFAYDLLAKAMRVDTILPHKYSTDIYDFNRNHIYNILHETSKRQINRRSPPAVAASPQCIGTFYQKCDSYTKFIDFHLLIQMGRATVRGLECMVFEQVTRDLPPAFFPYLNYRNKNGVYFKRAFEQSDEALDDISEPYTVVYYFASQNFEPSPRLSHRNVALGPLVQVDVYESGHLRYSFEVSNFVYQLLDAPNGDEQVDLFALRDRCEPKGGEQNNGAANYAQVTFELQYKQQPASGSAEEVSRRLGASMVRNKALIRAITAANPVVSATEIFDVESSLELGNNGEQLVIHGSCRFVHANVESVIPRVIGAANFWSSSAFHTSHEDCFWQAARRRQFAVDGRVLFVACRSFCTIDNAPIVIQASEDKKPRYESKQFNITSEFGPNSCAVMLMEEEISLSAIAEPLKIWDQAYKSLRGSQLDLAIPEQDETNLDGRLKFSISQLEISNDRWSSALGYEVATADGKHSSFKNGELLDGIGLPPASGHLQTPQTTTEMSYSVCHSICMANMSCNSFSVCVTPHAIECITSETSIGQSTILEQIEQKRKDLQVGVGKSHLIEVTREDELGANKSAAVLQFKIDIRCKLYKKNALELFRLAQSTSIELKNSNLRSVSGPAECADMCLKNNLAFLDKMSKLAHQITGTIGGQKKEHRERLKREYTSNLSLWCSSFRYLNLLDSSGSKEQLANKISPAKLAKAGLCSLMRPASNDKPTTPRPAEIEDKKTQVEFKQYRFIYSSLYEAHYGRRMLRKREHGGEMETVRLWASSAETCARACFLQANSLRSWCKSFDFIEKPTTTGTSSASSDKSSYCVLILAWSDLEESPGDVSTSRETPRSDNASVWHYELKDAFSIQSLAELHALMLAEADSRAVLSVRKLKHLGFWLLATILTAFICSSWLVVMKGDAILDALYRWRSPGGGPSSPPSRRIRFQLPDQIDLAEINSDD